MVDTGDSRGAVTLSLREGRSRREATRRKEQCDRTVPLSQNQRQTHAPHESVHVRLTDSTLHRLRTRMCNRTSHPHGFSVLHVSRATRHGQAHKPCTCACAATAVLLSTTSPTGQPEVSLCRSAEAGARQRAERSSVTAQSPCHKTSVRHMHHTRACMCV